MDNYLSFVSFFTQYDVLKSEENRREEFAHNAHFGSFPVYLHSLKTLFHGFGEEEDACVSSPEIIDVVCLCA